MEVILLSARTAVAATPWPRLTAVGIAGSLLVTLLVLAFLWPSKTSATHNIPVSITGAKALAAVIQSALAEKAPSTFDFVPAEDRDATLVLIRSWQTYGASVLAAQPKTPEVLTATAGSAAVVQILNGVATELQVQLAQQVAVAGGEVKSATVSVTDIVPRASTDAMGL